MILNNLQIREKFKIANSVNTSFVLDQLVLSLVAHGKLESKELFFRDDWLFKDPNVSLGPLHPVFSLLPEAQLGDIPEDTDLLESVLPEEHREAEVVCHVAIQSEAGLLARVVGMDLINVSIHRCQR